MRYYRSSAIRELSDRQIEVVKFIPQDLSNKEIARKLGVKTGTVRDHISKAFEILGLHSRMQLAIWVLKKGLISLDEIELPERIIEA